MVFLAFIEQLTASKSLIADPWDAEYLGCTIAELTQAAAVLDAQGLIILAEDEDFASVGKQLLATNGPTNSNKEEGSKTNLSNRVVSLHSPKGNPLGEGGS